MKQQNQYLTISKVKEKEEEDWHEWKEIGVRGSAFQPFILEQKCGRDTHAAMSNKFPVSCTKKTSIETRQVDKFTRGKCKPLVEQALNPPDVAN